MTTAITSLQNPHIKNLVKLRQRRQRSRQKLMLIDGARALRLALRNGFPVRTVFIAEDVVSAHDDLLAETRQAGAAIQPVTAAVFAKIGYGDSPDGVLGLAPQPDFRLDDLPQPANALYLIAEGLEKPGNLGAILRSADAASVAGLLVCDSRTDIYNPNVIRASRGAFFSVPVAVAPTAAAIDWLTGRGVQIVAATPAAERPYFDVDMRRATAIAVGAEHSGLTDVWFRHPTVRLPMAGQVDSLNVAQSASILLYEAVRQRLS